MDRPILTLDTSNRYALVSSHIVKFRGANYGHALDEPLHTITAGGTHHGEVRVFLMKYYGAGVVEPRELFAAQEFPEDYVIDKDADGKEYKKTAQVARCGNSVSPPFAEALVRANLPEHCTGSGNAVAFEHYKQPVGQMALTV
ncbi:hypothetical protein [Brevibacillus formosus]|uniref:hypothetical protein n=1 Tax=Brevibacillus formosus TaxID=54913 RepID=UPI003F1B390D